MKTQVRIWPRGMIERIPVDERTPAQIKAEQEADRTAKEIKDNRYPMKGKSRHKSQITEFSYASQQNMKKYLYKLENLSCHLFVNPHDSMFHGTGKTFQAKLKRADRFQKDLIKQLADMGYTGVLVRHLQTRKSKRSYYTGQVLPHWHLVICEPLSERDKQKLIDCIVAQMKLPFPWYEKAARKHAVRFFDLDSVQMQERTIRYLSRPIFKNVLKKLDGEPIGRTWFKIGKPIIGRPIEPLPMEPKEHAVFTRLIKRAVSAKIRQLGDELGKKYIGKFKRTKRLPAALKLHFLDPWSKVTAYLSVDTALRLYNYACMQALGKKNPKLRRPGASSALWELLPVAA